VTFSAAVAMTAVPGLSFCLFFSAAAVTALAFATTSAEKRIGLTVTISALLCYRIVFFDNHGTLEVPFFIDIF
jgi:hypothetical protein